MSRRLVRLSLLMGAAALSISGCILYPGQVFNPDQNADNLGGARFAQQQAVEGFDSSSYTLSDEQVEEFRDLLITHDVDPDDYRTPDTDGCTGGITTRVQMWFQKNGDREMIIDGCAVEDGSFEQEATDFFSGVREGGAPSSAEAPNSEIVAIMVVEDGREARQVDQAELARFVALVDAEGIVWSEAAWVELETGGVNPCDEFGVYEVSTTYAASNLVSGPVPVRPCGTDEGFLADLHDLFEEWLP